MTALPFSSKTLSGPVESLILLVRSQKRLLNIHKELVDRRLEFRERFGTSLLGPTPFCHRDTIRYAVVGLGYFEQMSILPAFSHAKKNSELAALISGDPSKLKQLGAKYGVEQRGSYV